VTTPVPPIPVTRVVHGGSSWIDPRLDVSWPPDQQAAWQAAVLRLDTGLEIEVYSGARNGAQDYAITVPGVSASGPFSLSELSTYFHGITVGFRAAQERNLR
jgi:hypothetical protein